MHYSITLPLYDHDWMQVPFDLPIQKKIQWIVNDLYSLRYSHDPRKNLLAWVYVETWSTYDTGWYTIERIDYDDNYVSIGRWLSIHVTPSLGISCSWWPFKTYEADKFMEAIVPRHLLSLGHRKQINAWSEYSNSKSLSIWTRRDGPCASWWVTFTIDVWMFYLPYKSI